MRILRRLSLEPAILVTLVATVVAVACASSWSVGLRHVALPARDVGLVLLFALAIARIGRRPPSLQPRRALIAGAGLLALAAVSIGWSVDPHSTVVRSASFGLVLAAAQALGIATAGGRDAARRLLLALLVAAAIVALIGVVVYAVSPHDALQRGTTTVGARFRGIGQSPNTVAMLFAVALPIAALVFVESRSTAGRLWSGAAFGLLAGSIAMSGSRGALVGAAFGLVLFGLSVVHGTLPRAAVIAGVIALSAALVGLSAIPGPLTLAEAERVKSPASNTEPYTPNDAQYRIRLEDEVGYGTSAASSRLLSGSGRLDAWRGAIRQGRERPLLGYGFGTEERVFVDRYSAFEGGLPENSFIGLFLQLGAIGVAAFLTLVAILVTAVARRLSVDRRLAAVCLGVFAAGLVLAFVQSYIYAFGNVATLTVWTAAYLGASLEERS